MMTCLIIKKKNNVPACVISIDNVFEQGWYYPQIVLQ